MLKKIVIGILCFLILAVTGIGIYIYTLNWNNHKDVVAKRFSQITGLKAVIDGNLKVNLLPKPKFSANTVKFIDNNPRAPLIEIDEISADVELLPLLKDKFILNSMSLKGATIHLTFSENGDFNWKGVSQKRKTPAGNVEVSFNNIKLLNSTISYVNKLTNDAFEIQGLSGTTSAQSLAGPYRVTGIFKHNEQDVSFNGDIVNNDTTSVRLNLSNAPTSSEIRIDGTLGKVSKGNIVFNAKNLQETANFIFGKGFMDNVYNSPLSMSFHYDHNDQATTLDNFTIKYGSNTAGSGVATIKKDDKFNIDSDFDMLQFDLDLLENIAKSIIASYSKTNNEINIAQETEQNTENQPKAKKTNKIKYNANINVKSNHAMYHGADAQKLNFGISVNNDDILINRFSVTLPGETVIKSVGKVILAPKFEYIFNQTVDAKNIKSFVHLLGTDLTKYAPLENRKDIFNRAQADFNISGDLDAVKISIAKAIIDSTTLSGNIGFIFREDKDVMLIQTNVSKVLFDKYLQLKTNKQKNSSIKNDFVYQINLAPWKGKFETDATIHIENAVYNNVPIEELSINFVANENKLDITKFSATSLAQAQVDLKANIDNVYTDPYFNELTYSVQTNNFPLFSSSLGIKTGKAPIYKHKLFASQGALSGKFSEFSLSSVQKFGDIEFSYSGIVTTPQNQKTMVNGNIELKANNFKTFVKDLGFNYNPDIPITAFTMSGNILGQSNLFEINDINAYLGANNITGNFKVDNTTSKPKLLANIDFDTFDVNRMFNLNKTETKDINLVVTDFIEKPTFSDKKIDFSYLDKIDFDINSKVNQLIWNNNYYSNFEGKAILNDKVLNVSNISAEKRDSSYKFDFVINSKNLASIKGNFDVIAFETPNIGGKIYKLSNAILDTTGSFSSIISSEKDFFENLNSKGRFTLSDITVTGWDFDIIKFEFEQRKTTNGLSDTIMNSLKTGKTKFSSIKGKYDIVRGVVVVDDATWLSPVADISMGLNLNLSNWQFSSEFNVFYHNASFSDVLEYTLNGNLANPVVNLEIEDVINRIGKIEQVIIKEKEDIKKKKIEQLQNKVNTLNNELNTAFSNVDRISLDIARFSPTTQNANVIKVYNTNIEELKDINKNLKNLTDLLSKSSDEKSLMDIEALLAKETSRINIIPKALEENYIVDSKYVFDDIFSKLTWLFNLAQNNSSYFNSLVDVYMTQVDILKSTDTPLSEQKISELQESIKSINADMTKIDEFYTINRDNYLKIIDTNSVNEMSKNNATATQTLQVMLDNVKMLNDNIVKSIDLFRSALGIHSRDYDLYLVFPPKTIEDIDTSLPTDKNNSAENSDELSKKKDELAISLNNVTNGIASLYNKFKQQKKARDLSNIDFGGLSTVIAQADKVEKAHSKTEETVIATLEVNKEDLPGSAIEKSDIKDNEEVLVASTDTDINELKISDTNIASKTPVIDNIKDVGLTEKSLDENKLLTANILTKTKEALANLMSNITKKEKEIVTTIPKINIENMNKPAELAVNEISINNENLPNQEEAKQINTHKINPVIAMNIGQKEEKSDIEIEISSVHERKTGFVAKESDKELVIAEKDDNIANKEKKINSKEEFLKLFSNTNDNFVKTVNMETPEIVVSLENNEIQSNNSKYVFKSQGVNNFSGNIGKSISQKRNTTDTKETSNRYVFNKSNVYNSKFDGTIGKVITLSTN